MADIFHYWSLAVIVLALLCDDGVDGVCEREEDDRGARTTMHALEKRLLLYFSSNADFFVLADDDEAFSDY